MANKYVTGAIGLGVAIVSYFTPAPRTQTPEQTFFGNPPTATKSIDSLVGTAWGEENPYLKCCNEATLLQRAKKYSGAEEMYNKAIALQPEDPLAYSGKGNCLSFWAESLLSSDRSLALDLFKRSIESYSTSIRLAEQPNLSDANNSRAQLTGIQTNNYCGRGFGYEMLGNIQQAISDYRKALEYKPNSKFALERLNGLGIK